MRHHVNRRRAYSGRRHDLVSRAARRAADSDLAVVLESSASRDEGRPLTEALVASMPGAGGPLPPERIAGDLSVIAPT